MDKIQSPIFQSKAKFSDVVLNGLFIVFCLCVLLFMFWQEVPQNWVLKICVSIVLLYSLIRSLLGPELIVLYPDKLTKRTPYFILKSYKIEIVREVIFRHVSAGKFSGDHIIVKLEGDADDSFEPDLSDLEVQELIEKLRSIGIKVVREGM